MKFERGHQVLKPLGRIGILTFCLISGIQFLIDASVASATHAVDVCKDRDDWRPVLKHADVKNIIGELKAMSQTEIDEQCSRYKSSILDLEPIVSDEVSNDICSENSLSLFRNYHQKYISIYLPELSKKELLAKKDQGLLPIHHSILDYFIEFVTLTSLKCARHLILQFHLYDLNTIKLKEDELKKFAEVRKSIKRHSISEQSQRTMSKQIKDIVVVPNYEKQVYLMVNENSLEVEIFNKCYGNHGKIYRELFLPFLKLYNLGYGFDSLPFADEDELKLEAYSNWIPVIETCELMRNVELIVDQSVGAPKVISKDQADKLSAQVLSPSETNKDDYLPNIQHEPVKIDEDIDVHCAISKFEFRNAQLIKEKTSLVTEMRLAFKRACKVALLSAKSR